MLSEQVVNGAALVVLRWRKRIRHQPEEWTPWAPLPDTLVLKEYDKFEIGWTGPSGAALFVEGLDPLYDRQPLSWTGDGPLWFPGTYRSEVRFNNTELWTSRIEVTSQRTSYKTFAPRMIETVEAWIPGITQEPEHGVWAHSIMQLGTPNADITKVAACVRHIRNVLSHPEIEFVLRNKKPQAHANTVDNRTVLKGLLWIQWYVNDRIRLLRTPVPGQSHLPLDRRLQTLTIYRHQLDRLLHHPLWDLVDPPRASDRMTQRAYRRSPYRYVGESLAALYHGPRADIPSSDALTRVRPTPEIFELWVLRNLLQTLGERGWQGVTEPPWVRHGRRLGITDPLTLSNSRWVFERGTTRLILDYDRALPDSTRAAKTTDGLWMSGQHNRPDFLLLQETSGYPPRAFIIEAKYRPRHLVWPTGNNRADSSKGQLQQYWSSLMLNQQHLDPPVLCVIPENDQPTWRADKTPDIEFVTMNPGGADESWKSYLASRLPVPSA